MDVVALAEGFTLASAGLSIAKQVVELMPRGADRKQAAEKLELAERQLALAQAQMAQELGYKLCKCTFPPQIMLSTGELGKYRCPKCGIVDDSELPAWGWA